MLVLGPATRMPLPPFPETTLRAAAVAPPIVVLDAPLSIEIPRLLGSAAEPAGLSPMILPTTRFPVEDAPRMRRPRFGALPEMTLPAPAVVPPTRLLGELAIDSPLPFAPARPAGVMPR